MLGTSHRGIRVPLPGSGFMVTYTSRGERDRTLRLAQARQQIAHEGNGNPTWRELTDDERATSELSARNWLRAAERAGLLAAQDRAAEQEVAVVAVCPCGCTSATGCPCGLSCLCGFPGRCPVCDADAGA